MKTYNLGRVRNILWLTVLTASLGTTIRAAEPAGEEAGLISTQAAVVVSLSQSMQIDKAVEQLRANERYTPSLVAAIVIEAAYSIPRDVFATLLSKYLDKTGRNRDEAQFAEEVRNILASSDKLAWYFGIPDWRNRDPRITGDERVAFFTDPDASPD